MIRCHPITDHAAGESRSRTRINRRSLSLIRGRCESWSHLTGSSDPATAGFVMQRHVQGMHRAISLVNRLVDRAFLVKAPRVESPPASMKKVKHRPDSVAESFGLFGRKAREFHADTVYQSSINVSRLSMLRDGTPFAMSTRALRRPPYNRRVGEDHQPVLSWARRPPHWDRVTSAPWLLRTCWPAATS